MTDRPLDGLKVIDITHVLAGPYCTYQLGLLGAEIIKIESLRGDMVRVWGGTQEQLAAGVGTGFAPQNAGKQSIAVDIHTAAGTAIVADLIKGADIVVENFRPGAMAKHKLDYETMHVDNPGLIYVSISAFGQNGPEGHRPGFDDVVQATSGFMSINERGDGPIRTGGPVLDYATGMQAASAVLAAVLMKLKTGEGQHIDIAMQDVTMLLLNRNSSITATTGMPPPPGGNHDGFLLGRYSSKDGYVMLAGYRASHQRKICAAIGLEEYSRLSTQELGTKHAKIEAAVAGKLLEKTSTEWDKVFSEHAVVGGGVRDMAEVLASGQPAARKLFSKVNSPAGDFEVTNAGYQINGRVFTPQSGIPALGEHTTTVLAGMGYSDGAIQRLREKRVVK